jgi:hypothetical protein
MLKTTQYTCNTPYKLSHKYNGFHNISFQTWKGFAIPKPRKKVVLTSYCDNILNHETNGFFEKYLFHVQYNMLYILIQVNEGIAKFFTLMVEGQLNQVMEFKCSTCIIMGYLHSP